MFVRAKKFGDRTYYYLVEGRRDGKRVLQKVVRYLGKTRPSSEVIERLIQEVKNAKTL